ncbi:hypothetical protein [Actinacidiphila oryziradicis]|uniref:hypothetical protein n=1 Tax=Actinacidiphila oryziradicis TaxID=2571141 RepID=UPI001FE62404|nr:hypothetical protein [Actinacidiphila oryziradicis]
MFAAALGYDGKVLALHQAAYALTTYDLFSPDGSDGQFRWCAALLNRNAVTDSDAWPVDHHETRTSRTK